MRAISAPSRRHSALCGGAASAVQMPLPLRRRAPHTVRRHGPHLGALLHKIRREEGRTGSPKTARAPLPLGGEGAGACRAICERYRHCCHCTRRAAAPCRRQRPQPYGVETHSRSHSLLQSRASATVRRWRRAQQQQRRLHLRICKMHWEGPPRAALVSLPTRCAIVAAAIAACCFSIDLVTASSSSSFYSKLDLPYTHSVYSIQNKTEMHSAMCDIFFMILFSLCIFLLLILSGLTSSWVGTLFDFVLRVVSKFTSVQIHVQCIRLSQIRFFFIRIRTWNWQWEFYDNIMVFYLRLKAEREFAKILRSLEQFIQTVKGQKKFW
jgi:hypothetical protein